MRAWRARTARQVAAIRHWKIEHASYETAPDIEATWFIDPPYEVKGSIYRHGTSGIDFAALASWCLSRRGQVIVCEQAGATWLPFRPLATLKGVRNSVAVEAWCYIVDGQVWPETTARRVQYPS